MVSISVDVSGIVDGEGIDADDVLIPLADVKAAIENLLNGVQAFELLMLNTATEVTISGGAITADRNHHRVDTELNAASDDLDTINGGAQGMTLYLRLENAARVVTVKHNTGNIYLSGGVDYTLADANTTFKLFYNGTKWTDVVNAGSGAAFERLERQALTVDTANFDFTGDWSDYNELVVILQARSDVGSSSDSAHLRLNGDATAANYHAWNMNFDTTGDNAHSSEYTGTAAGIRLLAVATGTTSTGLLGYTEITLRRPNTAASPKQVYWHGDQQQADSAGGFTLNQGTGVWRNTADTIQQITILPVSGANWEADSICTLYGRR